MKIMQAVALIIYLLFLIICYGAILKDILTNSFEESPYKTQRVKRIIAAIVFSIAYWAGVTTTSNNYDEPKFCYNAKIGACEY